MSPPDLRIGRTLEADTLARAELLALMRAILVRLPMIGAHAERETLIDEVLVDVAAHFHAAGLDRTDAAMARFRMSDLPGADADTIAAARAALCTGKLYARRRSRV